MSYALWAWDPSRHQPLPATFEDAAKTFLALQDVDDGVNEKLVEFARTLVARYPSRDMHAPGDPEANDAVWVGNPVTQAQGNERALFGISLPSADRLVIMRFFVEAANAAGLAVFDDQLGMAFLPGGQVLPQERQEFWAEFKQEMDSAPVRMTKAQVRKLLLAQLDAVLGKVGFQLRKSEGVDGKFVREIEGGQQAVSVDIGGSSPEFVCSMNFETKHDVVNAIHGTVCDPGWSGGGGPWSFLFTLNSLLGEDASYPISSISELKSLQAVIETKALPILDCCRTIRGLDLFLSQDGVLQTLNRRRFPALIVARLAGNPNFESFVEEVAYKYRLWPAERKNEALEKLGQLADYLRQNVSPVA